MEALLGPGQVTTSTLAPWAVDGIVPRMVVRPADAEQVGAVLRLCGELGAAVVPWGGGTAIDVGNPPRAADVILLTDRLSRVVDHDQSNLTVTVQAGVALGALARTLAGERQFLPLEPPHAEAATVGGTAAVNLNGPRRMLYGGARDLVIGVRVVQANGVDIKWGGKTVKNVAGYDMCKLFVGSLGTLGVLTELTLKVFPLPETSRTLVIWGRDLHAALALADRALASPLLPAAVSVLNPAAGAALGRSAPALLIRTEGFEPSVVRHEHDITAWAAQADMEAQILNGDAEDTAWRTIRNFGWQDGAAAIRLTTPAAAVAEVVNQCQTLLPSGAAVVAHAGSGGIWIRTDAAGVSESLLSALRELAARHAGHLLLARGPRDVKATGDVWSPAPAAHAVMRALKHAFDPQNIMNPGRFVAGL